jgi:hypothetical protein
MSMSEELSDTMGAERCSTSIEAFADAMLRRNCAEMLIRSATDAMTSGSGVDSERPSFSQGVGAEGLASGGQSLTRHQELESAILILMSVERVLTRDAHPIEWANTQNLLGTAMVLQCTGDASVEKVVKIRQAQECFKGAFEILRSCDDREAWFPVMQNVFAACSQLLEHLEPSMAVGELNALADYLYRSLQGIDDAVLQDGLPWFVEKLAHWIRECSESRGSRVAEVVRALAQQVVEHHLGAPPWADLSRAPVPALTGLAVSLVAPDDATLDELHRAESLMKAALVRVADDGAGSGESLSVAELHLLRARRSRTLYRIGLNPKTPMSGKGSRRECLMESAAERDRAIALLDPDQDKETACAYHRKLGEVLWALASHEGGADRSVVLKRYADATIRGICAEEQISDPIEWAQSCESAGLAMWRCAAKVVGLERVERLQAACSCLRDACLGYLGVDHSFDLARLENRLGLVFLARAKVESESANLFEQRAFDLFRTAVERLGSDPSRSARSRVLMNLAVAQRRCAQWAEGAEGLRLLEAARGAMVEGANLLSGPPSVHGKRLREWLRSCDSEIRKRRSTIQSS